MTERRWRLVRARSDAIPSSVRRFNQRARERRWQAARPWLVGAAGLALVGAAAAVVYGTPVLGVREVTVRGVTTLNPAEVRKAAAIRPGTPLASLDLGSVRRRVAGLPPVRTVRVERDWPGTVVITVAERVAVAQVPGPGSGYRLLDGTGVAFRTVPADPGLPTVRLAAPDPADATTRAALAVLAALTDDLRTRLVALVAESPAGIRLELRGDRVIIWGDATDNAAKADAATRMLAEKGNVIDVSSPQLVIIR
jgi:cell division protein FtsQ